MKMLDDLLKEDEKEQTDAAVKEYRAAVLPIYIVNERFGPEQIASGVLFSEDKVHLLMTAGHALDNLNDSALYVGGEVSVVQLKGRSYRTGPDDSKSSDKYDLAFLKIADDELSRLGHMRFLNSDDLDSNDIASKGHYYLLLGYPATKNKKINYERYKAPHNLYIYSSISPPPEKYQQIGISEATHVLLDYDRKNVANENNMRINPPKLQGISGGGIWRIRDYSNVASLAFPSQKKLVGIVIEWNPINKVIIGVRISCIVEAIRIQFPFLSTRLPESRRIHASINRRE